MLFLLAFSSLFFILILCCTCSSSSKIFRIFKKIFKIFIDLHSPSWSDLCSSIIWADFFAVQSSVQQQNAVSFSLRGFGKASVTFHPTPLSSASVSFCGCVCGSFPAPSAQLLVSLHVYIHTSFVITSRLFNSNLWAKGINVSPTIFIFLNKFAKYWSFSQHVNDSRDKLTQRPHKIKNSGPCIICIRLVNFFPLSAHNSFWKYWQKKKKKNLYWYFMIISRMLEEKAHIELGHYWNWSWFNIRPISGLFTVKRSKFWTSMRMTLILLSPA